MYAGTQREFLCGNLWLISQQHEYEPGSITWSHLYRISIQTCARYLFELPVRVSLHFLQVEQLQLSSASPLGEHLKHLCTAERIWSWFPILHSRYLFIPTCWDFDWFSFLCETETIKQSVNKQSVCNAVCRRPAMTHFVQLHTVIIGVIKVLYL